MIVEAPLMVEWLLSEQCNLKCEFCSSSHYTDQHRRLPDKVVFDIAQDIINLRVFSVILSGGEPLLHPQVYRIIQMLSKGGVQVLLPTNGTLIDETVVECLKESGVGAVQVSIDGKDEKTHDKLRGVKGVFKKSIEAVKRLIEAGLPVGASTTVSTDNIDEIPDIAFLLSNLGVRTYSMRACMPCGRAGPDYKDMAPTPDQWHNALSSIVELRKKITTMEIISMDPLLIPIMLDKPEKVAGGFTSCGVGRTGCAIGPDGTITPCAYIEEVAGNITETPLKEIWNTSAVLMKYRSKDTMLGGKCVTCSWNTNCGGGCKARSYGVYKDISRPDPLCWINVG